MTERIMRCNEDNIHQLYKFKTLYSVYFPIVSHVLAVSFLAADGRGMYQIGPYSKPLTCNRPTEAGYLSERFME